MQQSDSNNNKPIILFVIGGPGSGKGTICEQLKKKYGFVHLSTGDLLREEVASNSPKGKELNNIMKEGKLVPNEQVLGLLKNAITKHAKTAPGFLIDGYPREVNQAIDFDKQVYPAKEILYLRCSDSVMMERLMKRGQHSGRADDNKETIKKRLQVFHENTDPILKHYGSKVTVIDAEQDVKKVFDEVEKSLNNVLSQLK